MKLSTKPISSPIRTDKFPPPLMRFLRTNAGSRSRGKSSRSYPIFIKKKKNNTAIEITQEPSSPKVTCMGQVRVTRAAAAPTKCNRSFWMVSNPLFCQQNIKPSSTPSIKPSSSSSSCCYFKCKPVWLNWGFLFRRKETKTELNFKNNPNDEESELEDEERVNVHVNANAFVSKSCSSTSPPRNALLLTRCRSAPYRSSSLASMLWGSPEEIEKVCVENRERDESTEHEKEKLNLQRESVLEQVGRKDPKLERKFRFFKELEESLRERLMECELKRREEEEAKRDCREGPIVLTRCKSEPARTAYKFDPH